MYLANLCWQAAGEYFQEDPQRLDPFACVLGVAGRALYLDPRSLEWGTLPMLPGTAIVASDPGVQAGPDGPAFQKRREECEQAVELLQQYLPALRSLRDISPQEFAAYSIFLPGTLRKRAEHVVKEIARVHSAANALERADHRAFGALMYASQASLRDLYQASTAELDDLVMITRGLPGCLGTRLVGAGFGGCTLSMVEEGKAGEFIQGLQAGYQERTGQLVQAHVCKTAGGAWVDEY